MASRRGTGDVAVGWRHAAAAILCGLVLALHVAACEQDCARNDHQSCTIDRCVNGTSTHEKMANGAECLLGVKRGVCTSGFCVVSCSTAADCADGDDCTKDQCVGGTCMNTLQNPPAIGTCHTGVCFQGQPRQIPKPDGTPCGTVPGAECTFGSCSKCATPTDCGPKTGCHKWFCEGGKCIADPADAGMILPEVMADDCKWHVCDGRGNAIMLAADDLPTLDKTSCVEQTCVGWTAVFSPKIPGTECTMQGSTYGVCDGAGMCVECVEKTDCPTWEHYCFGGKCNRCNDGIQNGDETGVDCGNLPCGACLGAPCTVGSTCKTGYCQDGACCEIATCGICKTCSSPANPGKCVDIPAGQEDPSACTGMKACNGGGLCKLKNGYTCGSGVDCISNKCVGGICLP